MGQVVTIGLNIAKSVFQTHGVDGVGPLGSLNPFCQKGAASVAHIVHHWLRSQPGFAASLGHRNHQKVLVDIGSVRQRSCAFL